MRKLKLPRLPQPSPTELPPVLRRTAILAVSRREFLKGAAVLLVALATPWTTRVSRAVAAARGRFLTRRELATLAALCERILPADHDPGAKALGAATYVDRFLSAFDRRRVPFIFAGGPFSGRTPFPEPATGAASRRRPRNAFRHFVPLTRVQELRWRAELFGSAQVPGADFNDAALGPLKGLRDIYREGLAGVDAVALALFGKRYPKLEAAQQDEILNMLDALGASGEYPEFAADARRGDSFAHLLIQHTIEGCFSVPEYGGNRRGRGWQMIGLEGDDQPLGYSIFSEQTDGYNERPDHPMSTPNPDELQGGLLVPRPLGVEGQRIQNAIAFLATPFENVPC
jgi:hypothetical protein